MFMDPIQLKLATKTCSVAERSQYSHREEILRLLLFFKKVPRPGCEPGIFQFSFIFSLLSSALDHSATAPPSSLEKFQFGKISVWRKHSAKLNGPSLYARPSMSKDQVRLVKAYLDFSTNWTSKGLYHSPRLSKFPLNKVPTIKSQYALICCLARMTAIENCTQHTLQNAKNQ